MRTFAGYDQREAIGWHVFDQSVRDTSPGAVVEPLSGNQGDGSNAFAYERFRIPDICNWGEWALYVDGSDMLLRAPLGELWELADRTKAVQVVKHDYTPKASRKYIGTDLESDNRPYPRKNWSSVVLWNCSHLAHLANQDEIAQAIERGDGEYLHRFGWLNDSEIGELPVEWNWLDEYGENRNAKLLHWTNGIPAFRAYREATHAGEWFAVYGRAMQGMQ